MTEPDAPPKKRSFFKKAAWQKVKGEGEKEKDIFSHSSEFKDVIAEEARRIQKEKEQELARKEKERLRKEERRKAKEEEEQESKRRKVSEEAYAGVSSGGSGNSRRGKTRSQTPLSPLPAKPLPDSLSSRYESLTKSSSSTGGPQTGTNHIIDLGDSDSEPEDIKPLEVRSKQTRDVSEELEEIQDPYFAELAAKAHERRSSNGANPISNGTPTPAIPEAVVTLLISSDLPNTKPLIVKIKTTASLGRPRIAWCQKQGFTESETGDIFLTWKNRKLTEFTTIARLGVKVSPEGIITIEGESDFGIDDDEPPKIHLEAWTEELFKQKKAADAAAAEAKRKAFEPPKPVIEEPVQEAPAEAKMAVILRAKGKPEFKIYVKSATTFEHLASAYKQRHNLPKDQPITLMFDGDRLPPMDTVGDMDIQHMDAIEVHFK
ncbi:hypothetical protein P154DRAFT_520076 [Amniculicola lignicola CBS 123094]|uniref:Ubiquitin-like domain-containing protein n=1 Tax=Amniculicola lignicola CBS 123094 TaxID=1392246 RepID=A0A6A5WWJ5_9PLEO|nr:hypothetical protein P154DRAFT_520076 [Amniculicola lignicola CBS 123094]